MWIESLQEIFKGDHYDLYLRNGGTCCKVDRGNLLVPVGTKSSWDHDKYLDLALALRGQILSEVHRGEALLDRYKRVGKSCQETANLVKYGRCLINSIEELI